MIYQKEYIDYIKLCLALSNYNEDHAQNIIDLLTSCYNGENQYGGNFKGIAFKSAHRIITTTRKDISLLCYEDFVVKKRNEKLNEIENGI
jgi:hypothetical protein